MPRLAAGLLVTLLALPSYGQATNLSLYQDMAIECLGALPDQSRAVRLDAPADLPFLRSALVTTWQSEGRDVYLDESPDAAPTIAYEVESASVTYARQSRDLNRRVVLALRYIATDAAGRVLADDRCSLERTDVIEPGMVRSIEDPSIAVTQGELPEGGWFRRILEPAVLTTATAVAVYLFFALRSSSEGS